MNHRVACVVVLIGLASGCSIHQGAPERAVDVPCTEAGEVRVERYTSAS